MYRVQAITNLIPTLIPIQFSSLGSRYALLAMLFLVQSLVSSPPMIYFQSRYSINHRRTFRMNMGFSVQQHQVEQVNPFCRRPTCFDGAQALYLQSTGYRPLRPGSMFLNELNAADKAIPTFRRNVSIFRRRIPATSLIDFQTKGTYFQNLIPYSYIQTRCVVIYSIRNASIFSPIQSIFSMFVCLYVIFSRFLGQYPDPFLECICTLRSYVQV